MVNLMIFGPSGSMGKLISNLALMDDKIKVVAALDVENIGSNLIKAVGSNAANDVKIRDIKDLQEVIDDIKPDVAVDFTTASATEQNGILCVKNNIRCVIGTTGLSERFLNKFNSLVVEHNSPAVLSSNMAPGVNVLFKIASILTEYLQDWDIEIIETHHHRKVDAPSGTALTIGNEVAKSLGVDFEEVAKFGRDKGPNKRNVGAKNEIGILSVRAGDIVGDHTVLFAGPGERIELKHQAHSRSCFATGAIKAIKFLAKQTEAKIYDMKDVFNLS